MLERVKKLSAAILTGFMCAVFAVLLIVLLPVVLIVAVISAIAEKE